MTAIAIDGASDAVLVHDRSLRDDDDLLAAVSSLVSSSLQNQRMVGRRVQGKQRGGGL